MAGPTFRTIANKRIRNFIIEVETIDSGVMGAEGSPLPARGLVKLWPINARGERDRHYRNPVAIFQFDADGWDEFARLAGELADTVRRLP